MIISSSAKRTRKTAVKIAKEIGYKKKHIVYTDNLYHAYAEEMLTLISQQDDRVDTLMVVAHNP